MQRLHLATCAGKAGARRLQPLGARAMITLKQLSALGWARLRASRAPRRRVLRAPGRALLVLATNLGLGDGWEDQATDRRKLLLQYVQEAEPSVIQSFEDAAAAQVVAAMRTTVTNILGTLPPQFFRVSISSSGENLAQLMYSVIMTGYMFRNAWYRLELKKSLSGVAAAAGGRRAGELVGSGVGDSMGSVDDDFRPVPQYAPGSQLRGVQGEVVRWLVESGPEITPAEKYIEQLEREVASLREQIAEQATALSVLSGNELMDYLKTLDATQLQELTGRAGEDVLESMNTFIQRLMASEEEDWAAGSSDCTAVEMAQLLYWCMVVGFELRSLEVRLEMRTQLELDEPGSSSGGLRPGPPPSLPPGR